MQDKEKECNKRTQKDYSMSFKLQVVQEVERGELSITAVARSMVFKAIVQ